MKNPESGSREPEEKIPEKEKEEEQTPEEILDALQVAFEKRLQGCRAILKVLEPDGSLRSTTVLIEGFEGGTLYVSDSESSLVMGIGIDDVKKVEVVEKEEEEMSPEDFKEMLSQIPALKLMLAGREEQLKGPVSAEDEEKLNTEIEELREEIAAREELKQQFDLLGDLER